MACVGVAGFGGLPPHENEIQAFGKATVELGRWVGRYGQKSKKI